MAPPDRAFPFLRVNTRDAKPRTRGITEIRGPYYTPVGPRYLEDVFGTMGAYIDALKLAGGSFAQMPRSALIEIIDISHRHDALVSTGGFIEFVLGQGTDAVTATSTRRRRSGSTSSSSPADSSRCRLTTGCGWPRRSGRSG